MKLCTWVVWLRTCALASLAACGGAGGGGGGGGNGTLDSTGPYFTQQEFFDLDVSGVDPAADSAMWISSLDSAGGWGNGNKFQIDFSIDVLTADASTPKMAFTPNGDFSTPDCDMGMVPVPAGGDIEGNPGYACDDGGDCHMLVADAAEHTLYELYEADIEGSKFTAGCMVAWDLSKAYGPDLRGEQCTSADAAGLPITPLLFSADEVAAGSIDHAIRFTIPNDRTQPSYVHPAVHASRTTGGSDAPYYGMHLRLRADYPVDSLPSAGAKVVARALQKYGMYHADGGNIVLTAQADTHTTAKWDGLLDAHDLAALTVDDFDVIDHGPPIALTFDCVRE